MHTLVTTTLSIVVFICAMRYWQYDFGVVRLLAANCAALLFNLFAIIYLIGGKRLQVPRGLPRGLISYNLFLFAICITSFFLVDWGSELAIAQFFKNLASRASEVLFIVLVVLVMMRLSRKKITSLVRLYIIGAIISACWCIAEVYLGNSGIDLNRITFGAISTYRENEDILFLYEWDFLFRATGFAGVNAQGTYLASVVPLILYWKPFRSYLLNNISLLLCFSGVALTMSKNALIALAVAVIFPVIFSRSLLRAMLGGLCLPLIALTVYASYSWLAVTTLFDTRFGAATFGWGQLFSGRNEMYLATIEATIQKPLGYGLGQFSYYLAETDVIDLSSVTQALEMSAQNVRFAFANLHNNWLTWMFEFGFCGMIAYIVYYAWIVRALVRTKSTLALPVAAGVVSLIVSAMFNSTLDQFSAQVFIVLMSMATYCDAAYRDSLRDGTPIDDKQNPVTNSYSEPFGRQAA